METDVRQFVGQCLKCQTKSNQVNHGNLKTISTKIPLELVCVDVMGPLRQSNGYKYVYVMIDHFSKFVYIKPLKYNNASEIVDETKKFFSLYGAPLKILSDNGAQFTSKLFEELCKNYQVKHLRTTNYTPNVNGLVERANRTIKGLLRNSINELNNNWSGLLGDLQFFINSRQNSLQEPIYCALAFSEHSQAQLTRVLQRKATAIITCILTQIICDRVRIFIRGCIITPYP